LLAIWVVRSSLPEIKPSGANSEREIGHTSGGIFSFPHLWLGVLCLFLYVGVEVMAGDAIGTYGQGFGLPLDETKHFTSYTMFAMLLGYLAGLVLIPRFISQQRYLAISAVLGVLFTVGAFVSHGYVSVACVAALGFANAMMWPAIFPLAIKGLGRYTERGSALLVMGIVGGAIVPQLFVHLKQHFDFQLVFLLLMVPCYLYILYYGMRGHAVGEHTS
jgi:glucose/galactose transporter